MSEQTALWQEVRERYENGGETYRSLAQRYGLTVDRIGYRARTEGWRRGKKESARNHLVQVADALCAAAEQAARQAQEMNPKELKEMTQLLRELMQLRQALQQEDAPQESACAVQVVLEGETEAWSR